jgi:hypothetical protein
MSGAFQTFGESFDNPEHPLDSNGEKNCRFTVPETYTFPILPARSESGQKGHDWPVWFRLFMV